MKTDYARVVLVREIGLEVERIRGVFRKVGGVKDGPDLGESFRPCSLKIQDSARDEDERSRSAELLPGKQGEVNKRQIETYFFRVISFSHQTNVQGQPQFEVT